MFLFFGGGVEKTNSYYQVLVLEIGFNGKKLILKTIFLFIRNTELVEIFTVRWTSNWRVSSDWSKQTALQIPLRLKNTCWFFYWFWKAYPQKWRYLIFVWKGFAFSDCSDLIYQMTLFVCMSFICDYTVATLPFLRMFWFHTLNTFSYFRRYLYTCSK